VDFKYSLQITGNTNSAVRGGAILGPYPVPTYTVSGPRRREIICEIENRAEHESAVELEVPAQ